MTRLFTLALPMTALAACYPTNPPEQPVAAATLIRSDGAAIGTVRVFQEPTGVMLRINATGLPQGQHGVHVHATGRCDPPGFTSAGAHWNPAQRQHGHLNPTGAHLGDLGNLGVGADGKLVAGLLVSGASLNAGGAGAVLRDGDGAAVVLHAQPDDQRTDPSGNSGGRIACAVL